MKFDNGKDLINFSIPKKYKKIGIKLSGGADSALVAFMLTEIVKKERNDLVIHPISCDASTKPYQSFFAKKIVKVIEEHTGVKFAKHFIGTARTDDFLPVETYANDQTKFVKSLKESGIIDSTISGITQNPPLEVYKKFGVDGPIDNRTREKTFIRKSLNSWVPLINTDKKGVAGFYKKYNLDWLLFETRSCEKHTTNFTYHCGECWFCQERKWGFGCL